MFSKGIMLWTRVLVGFFVLWTNIFVTYGYTANVKITESVDIINEFGYIPTSKLVGIKFYDLNNFEFIWDISSNGELKKSELDENIKYFLTALTVPNRDMWVNLDISLTDLNVIGMGLLDTDIGKVLLWSDVKLKEDVKRVGERLGIWERIIDYADSIGAAETQLVFRPRFWIVPGEISAIVNKDGIGINKATLDVKCEIMGIENMKDGIQRSVAVYAKRLIERELLPTLIHKINKSIRYAVLRQVYTACILAQWYKKAFRGTNRHFDGLVDKLFVGGLESDSKWYARWYLDRYAEIYRLNIWGNGMLEYVGGGVDLTDMADESSRENGNIDDFEARKSATKVRIDKTKGTERFRSRIGEAGFGRLNLALIGVAGMLAILFPYSNSYLLSSMIGISLVLCVLNIWRNLFPDNMDKLLPSFFRENTFFNSFIQRGDFAGRVLFKNMLVNIVFGKGKNSKLEFKMENRLPKIWKQINRNFGAEGKKLKGLKEVWLRNIISDILGNNQFIVEEKLYALGLLLSSCGFVVGLPKRLLRSCIDMGRLLSSETRLDVARWLGQRLNDVGNDFLVSVGELSFSRIEGLSWVDKTISDIQGDKGKALGEKLLAISYVLRFVSERVSDVGLKNRIDNLYSSMLSYGINSGVDVVSIKSWLNEVLPRDVKEEMDVIFSNELNGFLPLNTVLFGGAMLGGIGIGKLLLITGTLGAVWLISKRLAKKFSTRSNKQEMRYGLSAMDKKTFAADDSLAFNLLFLIENADGDTGEVLSYIKDMLGDQEINMWTDVKHWVDKVLRLEVNSKQKLWMIGEVLTRYNLVGRDGRIKSLRMSISNNWALDDFSETERDVIISFNKELYAEDGKEMPSVDEKKNLGGILFYSLVFG